MILGIGTDLCEIDGLADAVKARGKPLVDRLFTASEQARAAGSRWPAREYAALFAVKEACAKALGTGITDRVRWTDIDVRDGGDGRLQLRLSGGADQRLRRIAGGGDTEVHGSLAWGEGFAAAFVLIAIA